VSRPERCDNCGRRQAQFSCEGPPRGLDSDATKCRRRLCTRCAFPARPLVGERTLCPEHRNQLELFPKKLLSLVVCS
jgi:hypothetical protein